MPRTSASHSRRWVVASALAAIALAAVARIALARVQPSDVPPPRLPKPRAHFDHAPVIAGPLDSPQAVTRTCLGCHPKAEHVMKTSHWLWL